MGLQETEVKRLELLTQDVIDKSITKSDKVEYDSYNEAIDIEQVNISKEHAGLIPPNPKFIKVLYGFNDYALYITPSVLKHMQYIQGDDLLAEWFIEFNPKRPFIANIYDSIIRG